MTFNFLPAGGEAGAWIAPSGTRVPMNQASAPFGWTSDTSAAFTDCSMRINSGSGGNSGGTTGWSVWNFGGTVNANAFTLSVGQLPAHNHGVSDPQHSHIDGGHAHGGPGGNPFLASGGGNTLAAGSFAFQSGSLTGSSTANIQLASTGITTTNTGSGNSITPSITTPQVKFTDHIIGVKS